MSFKTIFKNKDERFWYWFLESEDEIFNFEKNRDHIFEKLTYELGKVNKNLTFEFGPIEQDGKREFVISADGIKEVFHVVERLFNKRPTLTHWNVIKFRPRRMPLSDLTIGNKTVKSEEVKYMLFKGSNTNQVGIMLFFNDYCNEEKDIFWQIGYLLLDEALGEYDVETKVGEIVIESKDSKYYINSHPLFKLAKDFDEYFKL